ncbi:GTP cyclohydrolase 1 [Capsulimonas corticalis]|uniref:GTP cyclohydrolase 1 n=1 Tax=Capsulimonas corticalis TaxID=2219043 RepID=A0A402CP50_9BACT|nr:GTP cyclohydrolase I FolE [Capsulimonas corticalis]BDI33167.1 GTP cyclohydrolase 1 [Capsulimonas corticalis]
MSFLPTTDEENIEDLEIRPSRDQRPTGGGSKKNVSQEELEDKYRDILTFVGEDPDREGLLRTPHRVAEALKFLTSGYKQDVETLLNGAIFHEDYDDMVVVKDIEFYSMCEHHMLPFYGKVHVAYIPDGKIVGLSKIPRLVDMFSRRLQVQERLTTEIAEAIETALSPRGVAVVIEGAHMCMLMRGVQKQASTMVTSHVMGLFRDDRATRQEFMALVKGNSRA